MPTDEDVDMFLSIIGDGLSRETAEKVLRQQGTLELAVNKFYDSLDNPQNLVQAEDNEFDMNAFNTGRYGETDSTCLPAFRIEYPPGVDNFNASGPHSVAPSRPPSRISQHGTASGDIPMQSIESGQESGVIGGNSKPVFGPANKDQNYDTNSWAMVPISTKSTEFIPDAAPSQRKREEKGPAIIKPSPNMDYLPALISIVHTIPLFRNALLCPEVALRSYAAGEDWWKGTSTGGHSTVKYDNEDVNTTDLAVIYETQRLMAFLDKTDRAYGSIGGLQQMDSWKVPRDDMSERPNDEVLKFLLMWGDAYQSVTAKPLDGVFRSVISADGQEQSSALLDANIIHHNPSSPVTLYDVLDENLFESAAGAGTAFIKTASDVLIFRLESSDAQGSLDCRIPATLYADRYLEGNKENIAAMVQERKQYDARVKEIDVKAAKIKYHTTTKIRPGEQVETLALLRSSMVAFRQGPNDLIHDPRNATALAQLQSLHDSIEQKLAAFEEQKKQTRKALDEIMNRFRPPPIDGHIKNQPETKSSAPTETTEEMANVTDPPQTNHPYKLCGVATHSNVVYLNPASSSTTDSSNDSWWRIEYTTPYTEAYILRERLSLSNVLQKASSENRSALLIYATPNALSRSMQPTIELSEPLLRFVEKDNSRFATELEDPLIEPLGGWGSNDPYQQSSSKVAEWRDPEGGWGEVEDTGKDWEDISADQYFNEPSSSRGQQHQGSGMGSSDGIMMIDMPSDGADDGNREINGGFETWAGISDASSDTIGAEVTSPTQSVYSDVMEILPSPPPSSSVGETGGGRGEVVMHDVVDSDNGSGGGVLKDHHPVQERESRVQHIEVVETATAKDQGSKGKEKDGNPVSTSTSSS